MTDVEETKLPGVGVRHDFATSSGQRIGVIVHRAGYRELLIYDDDDPDACRESVRLNEADAHTLGDLLGLATVKERVDKVLRQSIEGLAIDWVPVRERSVCADRTIGETELRRHTGVTVVAVIRGDVTYASPEPEFVLRPNDTAVVIGTAEGISEVISLLQGT
jgi:TrkA domain protein